MVHEKKVVSFPFQLSFFSSLRILSCLRLSHSVSTLALKAEEFFRAGNSGGGETPLLFSPLLLYADLAFIYLAADDKLRR